MSILVHYIFCIAIKRDFIADSVVTTHIYFLSSALRLADVFWMICQLIENAVLQQYMFY